MGRGSGCVGLTILRAHARAMVSDEFSPRGSGVSRRGKHRISDAVSGKGVPELGLRRGQPSSNGDPVEVRIESFAFPAPSSVNEVKMLAGIKVGMTHQIDPVTPIAEIVLQLPLEAKTGRRSASSSPCFSRLPWPGLAR